MGKQTTVQNSFNLGEVSPHALGRFDGEKPIWKMGVAKLENFLNFKIGGAMYWPGTTYVASTKTTNQKIRLESVTYSISQSYVLELGDKYMRFFSNVGGVPGQVIVNASSPIDSYTIFLSNFNGANNQTAYTAETGQVISFFGSAHLDTGTEVVGVPMVAMNGSTDYLNSVFSTSIGSSLLTIEARVRFTATNSNQGILCHNQDGSNYWKLEWNNSSGKLMFSCAGGGGNSITIQQTWSPNTGQTYHVAIIRGWGGDANSWALTVDGTILSTATSNSGTVGLPFGDLRIGLSEAATGRFFNGWIGIPRISIGVARWTANFTPPPFPYGGAANWLTGTSYNVGDYVTHSSTVYLCLVAHTSGTFATDLANGDWTAQTQLEVVTPYALADVFNLQFAGKQDVTYIACSGYAPQKLKRLSATSFTLTPVSFVRGPFLPQNATATTITPSASTGNAITLTASTAIFLAGHVGALFRINSGATTGAVVKITSITSATVAVGDVQLEPDGSAGAIGGTSAYLNWAEGAFSNVQGWPKAVTFHEQRLVYAINDFFYASNSGVYDNFNVGGNGFGTATDSNSYTYQLATDQVATIRWLSSNTSLQVGTTGGTFSAVGGTAGITPTAITVTPDSDYNVYQTQPEKASSYLYYLDGNSFQLRQLVYDLSLSKQKSEDITALADHILRDGSGAVQMAHQKSPNDRLWLVRIDGQLAVCTRDSEQQVLAWSRRIPASSAAGVGVFESVAILAQDGADDQVWVSVQRNINGTVERFIEVFNKELPTNYWDYNNLDASLTFDNPITISGATKANPVVITANSHGFSNGDFVKIDNVVGMTNLNTNVYKVASAATNTFALQDSSGNNIDGTGFSTYLSGGQVRKMATVFSGLSYLNGETVLVQADGVGAATQYTVSGGSITLASRAAVVHAGLGYTGKIQLLPLNPQTKMQKAYLATLRVFKSIGGKLGFVDSFGNVTGLLSLPYPAVGYTANTLYSGDLEMMPNADYNQSTSILIQQDVPNPLFVLAAVTMQEANER